MRFSQLFVATSLVFLNFSAFGSVTCETERIVANQYVGMCMSTTIPDNAAGTSKSSCNGFKVTIVCDLHVKPNQLSLLLVGPDGSSKSTSTDSQIQLVDKDGNGVSVNCTF